MRVVRMVAGRMSGTCGLMCLMVRGGVVVVEMNRLMMRVFHFLILFGAS